MDDQPRASVVDGMFEALPGPEKDRQLAQMRHQSPVSPSLFRTVWYIHAQKQTHPYFDPEYVGSIYLRNAGNIAHIRTVEQPKNRINISN
jgi:hypothetical protein